MDNLVFEESVNSEVSQSEFIDKQFLYVNDNNNSSYSSQICFDTTALSSSGGYLNWSESFLTIPLVLQVQSTGIGAVGAAKALDYMVAMKNGYWQLLHSMTVEFNNGNVVQQVPFLNVFASFKNMTSWSANDIKDWGGICGFFPDSSRSWVYNNASYGTAADAGTRGGTNIMATCGLGICNNRVAPYVSMNGVSIAQAAYANLIAADPVLPMPYYNDQTVATTSAGNIRRLWNEGLLKRIQYLNFSLLTNDGTAIANFSSNQAGCLTGATTAASISASQLTFQSYVDISVDNQRSIIWDAVIRLKDVCDWFHKCPMMKGATMRIYVNTNQVYFTATVAPPEYLATTGVQSQAGGLILTSAPVILGGGGTCLVMLSASDIGQGLYNIAPIISTTVNQETTTSTLAVSLSIVRTQFSQMITAAFPVVSAPITSCRLYCPCYTMSPLAESRYLSLTPTKRVLYNDIFQYSFNNVSGSYNLLVSNGLPGLRGCLIVPFIADSANGPAVAPLFTSRIANGNAGATIQSVKTSSLLSPFSTSGATPDPIQITNMNIQVSGKNLFLQQFQYNFESFMEQVVSSNQLNGSLTTSLASGLIGFEDWQHLYRYYYGNVSRSLPSEDGVAKAIQILGTVASPVPINIMVFLEFEREITVDLRTGARIA